MLKQALFFLFLLLASSFDFGDITGGFTDATSTVANGIQKIVNEATSAINNTASTAIQAVQDTTNKIVSEAEKTLNDKVSQVEKEVNKAIDFIKNFSEQMCINECNPWYNLPCFLLFRCMDKLKFFFYFAVLPVLVIWVGFCTGIINICCIIKALTYVTGIRFIIWLVRKCLCMKTPEEDDVQLKLPSAERMVKSVV